jgi:transcriptional regulator GlxA family with amidase domain
VSLVALPESTPAILYGLYEVFASVGVTWAELTGDGIAEPAFDVKLVSPDGQPFTCVFGMPITPHCAIDEVERTDIIVIADLAVPLSTDPRGRWPTMAEWIRQQHEAGAFVCSVCTGSILMAETGLLDGLEATTHWYAAEIFERYYPKVQLKLERILVPAGPGHRLITGGGASSWEDLALHLVARFCGQPEATWTAKLFLFGDRSEGQLPHAAMSRHPAARGRCDCRQPALARRSLRVQPSGRSHGGPLRTDAPHLQATLQGSHRLCPGRLCPGSAGGGGQADA